MVTGSSPVLPIDFLFFYFLILIDLKYVNPIKRFLIYLLDSVVILFILVFFTSIFGKDFFFFEKYPFFIILFTFSYYCFSILKFHASPCQYIFKVAYTNLNITSNGRPFSRIIIDMCLAKNLPIILISLLRAFDDVFQNSILSYIIVITAIIINIFIIWSYTISLRDNKTYATFYDHIFNVRLVEIK